MIIALAGKQRQMRLIPVKALDAPLETEWIKLADTKGCVTFATGVMRPQTQQQKSNNSLRYLPRKLLLLKLKLPFVTRGALCFSGSYCLCVAVKRQVIIYEITRLKSRHKRLREVLLPAQAQSLDVFR